MRYPSSGVLPSRQHLWYAIYTEGVAPGYDLVVPSRHRSACDFYFYHGLNGLDGLACGYWVQDKNIKNPLERMEGFALLLCFRSGLIRASS